MFFRGKKQILNATPELTSFAGWSLLAQRFLPSLRRHGSGQRALEQLDSLPLSAHSSLALVRWHDQTLLLGVTPQGISLLIQSDDAKAASGRQLAGAPENAFPRERK